jgi:hypothetical protein
LTHFIRKIWLKQRFLSEFASLRTAKKSISEHFSRTMHFLNIQNAVFRRPPPLEARNGTYHATIHKSRIGTQHGNFFGATC